MFEYSPGISLHGIVCVASGTSFNQMALLNLPIHRFLSISLLCSIFGISNTPAQVVEFVFADSMETSIAVAYRNTQLTLRDPHVFVNVPVFGCVDFTDNPIPVVNVSFNGQVADMITTDSDGDGFLDLSILSGLDRFDPQGVGQMLTPANGNCAVPFPPSTCEIVPPVSIAAATTNVETGLCLEPVAGTTSGYNPPVPVVQDACFFSTPMDTNASLGDVVLSLLQAQLAFGLNADGTQLMPGLNFGFLREVDADNTPLPADLPVIGGQPLSSILPGGQGACAAGDDRDMLAGELGWWFYLEVTAEQVSLL